MSRSISHNAQTVARHYTDFFALFDRERSYAATGWSQPPPIVNLGYWGCGATSAREAQVEFVRQLASRIPQLNGARVLDVGCGLAGPASILAREYGAHVDGINIVEKQVAWARKFMDGNGLQDRVRVHRANAMDMPFSDQSFDVVFSLEAAHCFADKPRFLAEARRVLRPQGMLVLADIVAANHLPLVRWQPALKLNLVTAADWERMLHAAAFTLHESTRIGSAVYPGYRHWLRRTASERRETIRNTLASRDFGRSLRPLRRLQSWGLEFALCRSVLPILSLLRLREYHLLVAQRSS